MINDLLKSIHIISDEKVNSAPYNSCIKAQIVEEYSRGRYKVKTSEQSEFKVSALNRGIRYKTGDVVWVLIINNMFTKYRYILGSLEIDDLQFTLVSPNGTEFALGVDDEGHLTTTRLEREDS